MMIINFVCYRRLQNRLKTTAATAAAIYNDRRYYRTNNDIGDEALTFHSIHNFHYVRVPTEILACGPL